MHYPESHYRSEWQLASTPEEPWPLVSNTGRFNHATGVPSVEDRAADGARLPAACKVPAPLETGSRAGLVIEEFQASLKGIE